MCGQNHANSTHSLFGFVESSLIFFLKGIQILAIASTTQRRRDKVPQKSPFSFTNRNYPLFRIVSKTMYKKGACRKKCVPVGKKKKKKKSPSRASFSFAGWD